MRGFRVNTAECSRSRFLRLSCRVMTTPLATTSFKSPGPRVSSSRVFKVVCSACLSIVTSANAGAYSAPPVSPASHADLRDSPARKPLHPVAAASGNILLAGTATGAGSVSHGARGAGNKANTGSASRHGRPPPDANPMMRDPGPETDNMPIKRPPKSATQDRMVHDRIGRDTIAR